MPKCPNCPQFTEKDTDTEPTVEIEVLDLGEVQGSVRLVNCCSECGEELEECNFDVEIDLTEEVAEHRKTKAHTKAIVADAIKSRPALANKGNRLTVQADCSRSDRTQTKDRKGKPITSSRYMKRFYGYDLTVTIDCDDCGAKQIATGTQSDETSASGMESLV